MITITAKNTIKSDKIQEFKNAVKPLIEASQKEGGCISYNLFEDCNNPCVLTFIEEWRDEEAIALHNNSKHFTEILPKLAEFQDGNMEINFYKLVYNE